MARLTGLAAITVATFLPSAAGASSIASHNVPGYQGSISCLSASLCVVAGYDTHSVGDIVDVRNGSATKTIPVGGTDSVYAVSCAGASGCVALGRTSNGVGEDVIAISSAGLVTKVTRITVPVGVTLDRVACTSPTTCEVAGTDIFETPAPIEIGSWNGTKVSLQKVSAPALTTSTTIEGVTCVGSTCYAVGYSQHISSVTGLIVTEVNNHSFTLHTVSGDSLYSVACATVSICYGAGFSPGGGLVLTIKSGVASTSATVHPDLFGISCAARSCTAVGEELPTSPSSDTYWGTYVYVSSGAVSSVIPVGSSGGFDAVSRIGSVSTALGSAQGRGSEVARD